jgi:hypothetical protein
LYENIGGINMNKQIRITFLPGKGNPIDVVAGEIEMNTITALLDNKQGVFTNIGYIEGADVASYVVVDYVKPDPGPSPALKGTGGNENILWK